MLLAGRPLPHTFRVLLQGLEDYLGNAHATIRLVEEETGNFRTHGRADRARRVHARDRPVPPDRWRAIGGLAARRAHRDQRHRDGRTPAGARARTPARLPHGLVGAGREPRRRTPRRAARHLPPRRPQPDRGPTRHHRAHARPRRPHRRPRRADPSARLHGVARQPHRPPEPGAGDRSPAPRAGPPRRPSHDARGAVHRPRPVQDRERRARARHRRRAARRGGQAAHRHRPPAGHRRAHGRRRVRRRLRGPRRRAPRRRARVASRRGARRAVHAQPGRGLGDRERRHRGDSPAGRRAVTAPPRRRRRDVPGQGPRRRPLGAVRRGDAHAGGHAPAHRARAAAGAHAERAARRVPTAVRAGERRRR